MNMLYSEPRGDINRLPKWAQEYVTDLRRAIARMEDEVKKVSSQHPGSNLRLDGKIGYPAVTLPPDSTVQFYLGTGREDHSNLIEVHHHHNGINGLEVTAYGGQLLVLPRVSNGIALQIQGRNRS